MLWHKPIIVELALDFSAALRVKVDWPLATKPYDAEPDFSESYAALTFLVNKAQKHERLDLSSNHTTAALTSFAARAFPTKDWL